ncbi:MAG: hypothetical protein QNJ19_05815 [Woeseiaceae bacterium]|nr:hypothetical protein [Woeseiaceae bacterium]
MRVLNFSLRAPLQIALVAVVVLLAQDAFGQADTLAGARYDVVDRMGVNLASGQVQVEQTTLSIGGDMGLKHRISSQASDFVNIAGHGGGYPTAYGFGDEHRGALYTLALRKQHVLTEFWTMGVRVFGGGASADFVLTPDGDFIPYKTRSPDTLEFVTEPGFSGYVFTTADGTRMYYPSPEITFIGPNTFVRRPISKIVRPNGFTTEVSLVYIDSSIYSVRTNTGFQLKYDFAGSWTSSSPTKVTALNNRYERCPFHSSPCSPSSDWPYATYTWPVGQPDGSSQSLNQDSIFSVRDSEGRVTEYHHSPYQAEVGQVAPRLVRIKKNGKTVRTYDYEFNQHLHSSSDNHSIIQTTGIATVDVASEPGGGDRHYTMHIPKIIYGGYYIGNINAGGGGPGSAHYVESSSFGALVWIDTWEQDIRFYYALIYDPQLDVSRFSNWITSSTQRRGNVVTTYQYDDRGNVTERNESGAITKAYYPASCTAANRKYCNKPEWIEDPRGNRTNFTYHPQSGQIKSRTLPPNSSGVRAKTVYNYATYYAHYKKDSETIEAADSPIWLVSSERSCQNSAMNANDTCSGNDDVVTSYQYDYYNLYVKGVAVTAKNAQGTTETRRTCYEYDKLGNRIGEISPRANLATCL